MNLKASGKFLNISQCPSLEDRAKRIEITLWISGQ